MGLRNIVVEVGRNDDGDDDDDDDDDDVNDELPWPSQLFSPSSVHSERGGVDMLATDFIFFLDDDVVVVDGSMNPSVV